MKKNVRFQLKKPEIILISSLIFALCLPAVIGLAWSNLDAMQQKENRKMAQCPSIQLLAEDPQKYIGALNNFLNDRVGFRHSANKVYRKIRYYIFRDPPLQNISMGKDGFVFMNSHRIDKPNFVFDLLCEQQIDPDPKLVESMDKAFTDTSLYFTGMGIDTTIAAAPTDISLYPDKLPMQVDKKYRDLCRSYGKDNGLLFKLRESGKKSGNYRVYYPYELFKSHRDEPYFFPKEKWHWTGRSTFLFARDLAYQTGAINFLKIDDPAVIDYAADDLWMFFGFSRSIKAYTYPYKEFNTIKSNPKWQFQLSSRGGLTEYTTSNSLSDKRALLIANSFGIELAPHLAKVFKELYYFNLNFLKKDDEMKFFREIAKHTNPDFVYVLFDDAGIIAAPERLAAISRMKEPN